MSRVLITFGTRPEAIKMAPVVKAFRHAAAVETRVCVSAQHRQMLDQVLSVFSIRPEYDLNLMRPGQTLAEITSGVLSGVGEVLENWRPDLVLVHGDTTTTFSASLAAYYAKIAVGHVEAGLRTGRIYMPWPEEMNRKLTGAIARLHFAPTEVARGNLLREGVAAGDITVTGNTVIDALLEVSSWIQSDAELRSKLDRSFSFLDRARKLVLVTGHRRENLDGGIERVCLALRRLAARDDVEVLFAVHLNPQVQRPVRAILEDAPRVFLIDPQDYVPFVYLMNRAHLLLTDSGGMQEEAPSLGKPVLVTRETTERPEAVKAGAVRLVGSDTERIVREAERLLDDPLAYKASAGRENPYGDGNAAARIVAACERFLEESGSERKRGSA